MSQQSINDSSIVKRWRLVQLLLLLAATSTLFITPQQTEFSPLNRHWGYDLLLYLPKSISGILVLFLLFSLLPTAQLIVSEGSWAEKIKSKKNRKGLYLLLSGIAAAVFWQFRVKYYFLGDFNIRMLQSIKGEYVSTEYATMWLLHHLHSLGTKLGLASDTVFKLYSVIAGVFYVLLAFLIAEELTRNKKKSKLFYILIIVCSAQLLLFCGYVEIYATPAVLLTLFVYFAARFANKSSSKFLLIITYGLALASHLIAIAALPALMYLLFQNKISQIQNRFKLNLTKSSIVIITCTVIALLLLYAKGHQFLMVVTPPTGIPNRMTLLSLSHIWEFLNGQVLCSGLALLALPYLLYRAAKKNLKLSISTVFFLLYAFGMLLLTFVSDLQRGSGDWDIMSFTALPLSLSLLSLCYDVFENRISIIRQIIVPAITFNLVSGIAWIGINHTDASIKKITDMLENDPASYYDARITGPTQLAICFQNNNLPAAAEPMAAKACAKSAKEDITPCLIYARCLVNSNRMAEAAIYIEDLINNRSAYSYEAYYFLLPYLEKTQQHEKTLFYVEKLYAAYLEKPQQFLLSSNFDARALSGLFTELYNIKKESWTEQQKSQALQQIDYIRKWQNQKR